MQKNENRSGYKKTKVGWIPEEWKDPRLEAICAMKSGETITSKSISDNAEYRCFGGNGVRGFTATYTHDGKFVLIGRQGALCGNIHLVSGKFYASEHAIITTASKMVNLSWLAESLKLLKLNRHTESSAQPGLSVSKILRIRIPLPPLREQKAIASVLECWDRAIHKYEEKIEKKKNIKKGLMQRLLSGKQRLPGFAGEWNNAEIGNITMILSGGTPAKSNSSFWEGSIPWISSSDLEEDEISDFKIHRYISEEALKLSATKLIPANSILVVSRVGVGKVALSRCDICTSQDFQNLVIIRNSINEKYLTYQLKRNVRKLVGLNQGTSICGFLKKDLKKLQIPLPPLPEQKAIASVLSSADSEIKALEKKLTVVKEQKKYLLNNLVTGTIRLPEFCESVVG